MKKCLLWGMGKCFNEHLTSIKYHELAGHFKVVGITSNTSIYTEFYEYTYIPKENLIPNDYDFVIILSSKEFFKSIYDDASKVGFKKEVIFPCNILDKYDLNIDKYISLRENPPSIFSNNCWGGFTYHELCLEFSSPLINMYVNSFDYIKLLKNPEKYMNTPLEPITEEYQDQNNSFPIAKCDDILLHLMHYDSFENANMCWEKRKKRINWNNLFIMMHTDNPLIADEFSKLPYKNKICFVPFQTDKESLAFIELVQNDYLHDLPFYEIVNRMATNRLPYYDVFELIETSKIVKLPNVIINHQT